MTKTKNFPFTSILGWSVSRYDLFKTCKRQYFYNYYGKHDPDISRYKINELKNMTTIPMEIGTIVHDVIKVLLNRLQKTSKPIDKKPFFDFAFRKTEEHCTGSKSFCEVYYGDQDSINPDELFEKVETLLKNFLSSDRLQWLMETAIISKDDWLIEPSGYGETRIDDLKAYCKVDFLFPIDDKLYILDWKTGKPNPKKHKIQLRGYAAWASYHYDLDIQKILPIVVHLFPEYSEETITINEFDYQEFAIAVKEETDEMYQICQDVENNIPLEKEAFPLTSNTRICNFCNFRELCNRT